MEFSVEPLNEKIINRIVGSKNNTKYIWYKIQDAKQQLHKKHSPQNKVQHLIQI